MAGRHSVKKSKKSLVITIIVAVVVAAIACVIIFVPFNRSSDTNTKSTTIANTTSADSDVLTLPADETSASEQTTAEGKADESSNSDFDKKEESSEESQVVIVPTEEGAKISYFNGSFTPYKAYDAETEEECSLKEVFGSSYSGGSLDFKDDGSFKDGLSLTSANSGAYVLSSSTITATYTNDKNMFITVSRWDGDTPSEIVVNYGGYEVFFN